MEQSYVLKGASAIVLTFVVFAACRLAQAVIEPVVFALFVIAVTWPLDKALQKRMPKAAALLLTITITATVIFALFWMIAWGGHEVAELGPRQFGKRSSQARHFDAMARRT